ncbi:MAG: hypothetical protein HZA51_09535 [Planctomycetes bacterium]|nr:hypothetical protein [Planctomycetota bacterium]
MRVSRLPYSLAGQLIIAVLGGVMAIGAPGCNGFTLNLGSGGGPLTNGLGFLLNTDTTSELLAALRTEDGNNVYVFGTRTPDGNVDDVQAAVLQDAAGNESSVNFDGGLLSKAKGADGSTIAVTYDERTTMRLRGHMDIVFAGADPGAENQRVDFDIDLQQALADIAAQFEQATGIDISTSPPPPNPGGREIVPDVVARVGKTTDQSQLIYVFAPFFVYGFASLGYVMVQVMAACIEAMVQTIVNVAKTVIVAAFSPLIVMGEILRGAVGLPLTPTNLVIQLALAGVLVPPRPYL